MFSLSFISIINAAPAKNKIKNFTVFSPLKSVNVENVEEKDSNGSKNNLYKNAILFFI